jgi:hypothetical protein
MYSSFEPETHNCPGLSWARAQWSTFRKDSVLLGLETGDTELAGAKVDDNAFHMCEHHNQTSCKGYIREG